MNTPSARPRIGGMLVGYHVVCPRKAWLSMHGLWMEQENEDVQIGRLIDETTYSRARKAIELDAVSRNGTRLVGKIDVVNLREGVLHEVKKSKAVEDAHIWQLRFYLWLLELSDVRRSDGAPFTGRLDYPRLRRSDVVHLSAEHVQQLEHIVDELSSSFASDPPARHPRRSFCRKCAFEELCYA
jgi:CRISPR-associated exonuclease Cas4